MASVFARHQVAQQVFESDAGDGFALEQRAGRVGVNLTNLEVGVEQEQTFAHGAQNVFRLLAGGERGRGLLAACQREVTDERGQGGREAYADEHHRTQGGRQRIG